MLYVGGSRQQPARRMNLSGESPLSPYPGRQQAYNVEQNDKDQDNRKGAVENP